MYIRLVIALSQVFATLLFAALPAQTPGWSWTQLASPTSWPSYRYGHSMAYDIGRGKALLFGGYRILYLDDTWEWNGAVWSQVAIAVAALGVRLGHAMAYDIQRGRVVMFGGFHSGYLGDTWEWNGTTWALAGSTGTGPGARGFSAMAYDSIRGRTVLFGGSNGSPQGDTWEWDGVSWVQKVLIGAVPAARGYHSMTFDSNRGKVVMYGGASNSSFFGDTWEWDGTIWTQVALTGPAPGARQGHTAAYDSLQGMVVLFGGYGGSVPHNDLWLWDGSIWSQVAVQPGALPAGREQHAMAYDSQRRKMVLYGGYSNIGGYFDDTWELTGPPTGPTADITCTAIQTSSTPTAVISHSIAPLPNGGALHFGGTTSSLPQPFTFVMQNGAWTKQFSILNPMPRVDASLLLDPARQNNILFGGRNPLGTALNETWTWQNGQWNYLPLAVAPTPRSGHRMVFDPITNVGLLFGGKDAQGSARNDFWRWNGTTWSQLTPTTLPPARSHHGFAYDQRRQRAVVYGGVDGTTRIDDVWEWDGASWAQIAPATSGGLPWTPGARSGHGMAYDPRSERIVVHGGEMVGCQQDAWSWDGTQWMLHIATTGQPSARTGAALWLDPSMNQLLLFGGGCGTSYTNDLWSLTLPVFSRWSNYGQGCVGSLGMPTITVVAPSAPVLGTSVALRLGNIFGQFVPAFAAVGFSRTTWNGIPLPVDLTPVGLAGCQLMNSLDQVLTLTAPISGIVNWSLALPNNPQLLGVEIFVQGLGLEVPGYPRFGSMTEGLLMRLGDR